MLNKKETEIIKQLIGRLLKCSEKECFYTYENNSETVKSLGTKKYKIVTRKEKIENEVVFIETNKNNRNINRKTINTIKNKNQIIEIIENSQKKEGYSLSFINSKKRIKIYGNYMDRKKHTKAPKKFKVLAIIHVYNEEDVIEKTIKYLLRQGIDIYLLDNHSIDKTPNKIKKLIKKYPKNIFYEKYPKSKPTKNYEWYKQLKRTEEISKEKKYNWYIHYDADEKRIAPFKDITLKDYIYLVDRLGYTTIENSLIEFKITNKKNKNIFMKNSYFVFNKRPGAFLQTKTWKKAENIDLKHSGGHIAKVKNNKTFPIKILTKHYPLRSFEQAKKKIFIDRLPRINKEKRQRGWHTQYDYIKNENDIINNKKKLYLWDRNTYKELYIPLFFGVGIKYL